MCLQIKLGIEMGYVSKRQQPAHGADNIQRPQIHAFKVEDIYLKHQNDIRLMQ